ncbi:P2Y purinoceptor 13-like [Lampris incognitus]|uniref:P2Y purinoceptor 13-like n=1 Tax=Lampris incognitus TaxID=2546036 RepID=UPI0024B48BB3|nr:P2Y purinoceptor 13-like [Lampris incognitus]
MASVNASSACAPFNTDTFDVAVACLFFLIFPLSLLLNGVAAWISLHLRSTSTFIVYLKNLVAADLLMTLAIPLIAANTLPGSVGPLKVVMCRYTHVVFYCCLYTSICLMGLISLDRFFKVVRPCGRLWGQSLAFSHVMSAVVWGVIFGGTGIPTVVLTNRHPGNVTKSLCMSMKSPAGLSLHAGVVLFMNVLFCSVGVLTVVCYLCITSKVLRSFRRSGSNNSQGKRKTKLRVFLVLLVFFVCFLPFHMVRIPFAFHRVHDKPACVPVWMGMAHDFTRWLSTTNTCLDPLLYIYLCREFKEKLDSMLRTGGSIRTHPAESEDASI